MKGRSCSTSKRSLREVNLLQQSQCTNQECLGHWKRTLWCVRALIAVVEDIVGERLQLGGPMQHRLDVLQIGVRMSDNQFCDVGQILRIV